jgi:nitroreductase/NAD-dependent dihydropyrimidine dehydrogenase PreA subunit
MDLFQVNQDTCNQDGICAADCPAGLIDFQKGGYPKPIPEAEKLCIRCGHCVAVCPTGSLSHREMPMKKCPPVKRDLQLSVEHCEHFLRNRRSIRVYKDKPVSQDELTRLIEIARYAPTGRNCQCVEWLVLNNRDELDNLKGLIADWMSNIPDTLVKWEFGRWKGGQDVILRDAPAVVVTHAEKTNRFAPAACTIALSYLDLTATTMGLGCCWAGFFMSAATLYQPFIEALSLPEGHQCLGAIMVGYPKFSYQRLPLRKPPPITWRTA